jgi:hypothetical protein
MILALDGSRFIGLCCVGIGIAGEEKAPLENSAIRMTVAIGASHFRDKDRPSVFELVVTACAIDRSCQIMGGP